MGGISDWFGISGLRRLGAVPLPDYEKHNLFLCYSQVKALVEMEKELQSHLALMAKDRDDAKLPMIILGINYSTALGIIREIGDVKRFPTKHHLCSYAAVVPRADNSDDKVRKRNHVKTDDMIIKSLLCIAVQKMLKSVDETAVTRFYRKKEKATDVAKAQVAASHKLACAIWGVFTYGKPYIEEDEELTVRKTIAMNRSSM
jgi:transposase